MFKHLFNLNKHIRLGRWGNIGNKEKAEIKFILANSDHCGDIICGKPLVVKDIIDNKTKASFKKNGSSYQ